MPTSAATRARVWLCGAVAAALALSLVGCNDDEPSATSAAESLRAEQQRLLDIRDRAVRTHNQALFLSTIARRDQALVRRQLRWFNAVSALPWRRFSSTVTSRAWPDLLMHPRWGKASVPRIRTVQQVREHDVAPVVRVTGLAFARRGGRLKIVADRTRSGRVFPGSQPAPWDLTAVEVRRRDGVIGLFDQATRGAAGEVMDAVSEGIDEIASALPYRWNRRVIVYAFGDRTVLDSFDNVPGGKIDHLGAMTFPVFAAPGSRRVAGVRFTVMPSSIAAGQPFLGRIIRHELTHVAIGRRDDGAPLWLSEGIAEYLGAREIPRPQRRIAAMAVSRAREDGPVDMPASDSFNGPEQDWHYALSWMACDYIAHSFGESRLWQLADELSDHGRGTPDDEQQQVLIDVLGMDSAQLADHARQRIRAIYQ